MKRRLVLLGPPGSGKGTLGAQLKEQLGLPHVGSGNLLRNEMKAKSVWGERARPFVEQGELVPDETVFEVMNRWFKQADFEKGFALDGFPRTLNQAIMLDRWLVEWQVPIELALLFTADQAETLERILGRRSCPRCGRVYHIKRVPPRVAGVCDDCQVDLVVRNDDREEVMRKRFGIYLQQTAPIEPYYERQGKLVVINTTMEPERRLEAALVAIG